MEAYKKGASLTEVERMHNEWKILYQVSDLEAKVNYSNYEFKFNCKSFLKYCKFYVFILV